MTGDPGLESRRLASRSAQVLLLGAGLVTVLNASVSHLHGVNVAALRVTGLMTMAASLLVPLMPWRRHARLVSYGIVVAALIALVGTDQLHHYSRSDSALAVYPIFFILVIAWAGLTQPRGTAVVVACLSGVALAWLLESGGHASAVSECIAVTVPAAAILGEVISWTYGRALRLARLDAARREALEALVAGASQLQGALTAEESEAIVIKTAADMFRGRATRFELSDHTVDDGPAIDDAAYDRGTHELRIRLRGQSGVIGTVVTIVDQPDTFALDVARLYSQHIGTRLEQLRVIDALSDAATHDALTGIGNRRAAQDSIANLQPGDAVFVLDLDHFKAINDSLGHQTGDAVLTQFGNYLRTSTRPTDAIARYGGEEFLLISHASSSGAAEMIAHRLLEGWREQRPLVTFSIGYSVHADGDDCAVTVDRADMALYQAKRQGRDRAVQFSSAKQAEADLSAITTSVAPPVPPDRACSS